MQLVSMVYSILYINEPYVSANYIRSITSITTISIMFSHNFCIFMYIVAYIIEFDM